MTTKKKRGLQPAADGSSFDEAAGHGGAPESDNVGGRPGSEHDSRGSRGVSGRSGGPASFEVESEDYARNMGHQDRGRMTDCRSERDNDFTALGRQARFGDQGDQGSDQANENQGRPLNDEGDKSRTGRRDRK